MQAAQRADALAFSAHIVGYPGVFGTHCGVPWRFRHTLWGTLELSAHIAGILLTVAQRVMTLMLVANNNQTLVMAAHIVGTLSLKAVSMNFC